MSKKAVKYLSIRDEKILRKYVSESKTRHEVLKKMGLNVSGGAYSTLHRYIKKFNINTDHFLSQAEIMRLYYFKGIMNYKSDELVFVKNSDFTRHALKNRIIDKNLLPYKCQICDAGDLWLDKKISLILDHIDGDRNNNELSNLRFLCPNCNATLDTHCIGKRGLDKKKSKNRLDKRTKRYAKITTGSEYVPRVKIRKVERPSKEELIKLLDFNSWVGLGRKYGVSDNAVRKWAKYYKII